MSDRKLRDALVTFLAEPALPGMQKVYRDMPWLLDGGEWNLAAQGGWGAIAYVHIDDAKESRITFGGENGEGMPTGQKRIDYTVSIVVAYQYVIPTTVPDGQDESAWVDPLDALLDALKDRLRSDPTLGIGSAASFADAAVFQAGQNDGDIRLTRDIPRLDRKAARVWSWSRVEFDAVQIITA